MSTITKLDNPYERAAAPWTDGPLTYDQITAANEARRELVCEFAWAIPNLAALEAIKRHSPQGVVEIGPGGGYWMFLLRQIGVDVIGYDVKDNDFYTKAKRWVGESEILTGDASAARMHPDRTLFLCWPMYDNPQAYIALKSYTGQTLVYVGEGRDGCTADDQFFDLLEVEWAEIDVIEIQQWPSDDDYLRVYRRHGCHAERGAKSIDLVL